MGYIAKRPCAYGGCKNDATSGQYCDEHKRTVNRATTSKHVGLYKTERWKKERKQFLENHVWCEECLKCGLYTPANTVHHAHGFCDYVSFFDSRYWVALCTSCHSKIHTQVTNDDLWNNWKGVYHHE